jgi:hypothetical protein
LWRKAVLAVALTLSHLDSFGQVDPSVNPDALECLSNSVVLTSPNQVLNIGSVNVGFSAYGATIQNGLGQAAYPGLTGVRFRIKRNCPTRQHSPQNTLQTWALYSGTTASIRSASRDDCPSRAQGPTLLPPLTTPRPFAAPSSSGTGTELQCFVRRPPARPALARSIELEFGGLDHFFVYRVFRPDLLGKLLR